MTRPGAYTIYGLGGELVKAVLYPKFQGKTAATSDSGISIPGQLKPLPVGNSGAEFPQQFIPEGQRMTIGADDSIKQSWLGTPVFADILIKASTNEDDAQGLYLDTVLITVSQEKHIVKTLVNGRNGTVKEYFSDGDYSINLKGAIVGRNPNGYPQSEVQNLIRLLKYPDSIVMISPFLQLFGIFEVAIEAYDLEQLEGFQNMQAFSIDCCSDLPIELIDVEDDF